MRFSKTSVAVGEPGLLPQECPVKKAHITLELQDGRVIKWDVDSPDATKLLIDEQAPTQFGPLPIDVPWSVAYSPAPVQLTVTFGFRWGRRDNFLAVQISDDHGDSGA